MAQMEAHEALAARFGHEDLLSLHAWPGSFASLVSNIVHVGLLLDRTEVISLVS